MLTGGDPLNQGRGWWKNIWMKGRSVEILDHRYCAPLMILTAAGFTDVMNAGTIRNLEE